MTRTRLPVLVFLAAGASASDVVTAQQVDRRWLAPVSGNWTDNLAWDPVGFPNNAGPLTFRAFIDVGGSPYTVTLDQDITIDEFTIGALGNNNPTLDLTTNNLTVEFDYIHRGGTVRSPTGTGTVTVAGTSFLTGARFEQLDFVSNGVIEFDGPVRCEIVETCIIHNGSRINWSGTGGIRFFGGGELDNGFNSTFEITNDQSMTWDNAGVQPAIFNAGTIVKTTATGTTRFTGVELVNDGTLDVTNGTIRADTVTLAGGNTLDRGTWIVRDNATLSLPNAVIAVNDAAVELRGRGARFTALSNNITDNGPNGTLTIAESHRLFARAGNFTNAGTLTVDGAGSRLSVAGGLGPANFINTGTATANGSGTIDVTGDFTNNGTLTVGLGSDMLVNGTITNFTGGTFTAGIFNLNGRLRSPNLDVSTVEAELNYDDPNPQSGLINTTTGQNALFNLNTIGPAGRLRISNGRNLEVAGNLALAGELTLGQGLLNEPISTFTVPGTLTQTSGVLRFGGGRLNVGELDLQGGSIQGNGTINGRAVVNGVIDPGGSPGLLRILGDLVLMASPRSGLTIEIAGLVPVLEFDHVRVADEMRFEGGSAGTLDIQLLGGFSPVKGDSFRIMAWGSRAGRGEFAQVNFPTLPGGLEFRLIYRDRGLFAAVVPAPAGVAAGAFVLLAASRRRRA